MWRDRDKGRCGGTGIRKMWRDRDKGRCGGTGIREGVEGQG